MKLLTAVVVSFFALSAVANAHFVSKPAAERYAKRSKVGGLCGRGAAWTCATTSIKVKCIRHDGYHSQRCKAEWREDSLSLPPVVPASSWQKCSGEVNIYHTQSVNNISVTCN